MESRYFGNGLGQDTVIFYGASVTIADLIMKDGKSLEKIGVIPDVPILPSGRDLLAKRDIVLSKALESLGLKVTPEDAFKMFPDESEE